MAMAISMECGVRCAEYRLRTGRRKRKHHIRTFAAFAAAAAALVLMTYGQHWLLQEAPATTSELAAATYAIDALSGGTAVAADANGTNPDDKEVAR
jgi:hypothetical protein